MRVQKGGDLHDLHGNRKTTGAKPWFKITADSVRATHPMPDNIMSYIFQPMVLKRRRTHGTQKQTMSILRSLEMDLRRIVSDAETSLADKVRVSVRA